MPALLLAAGSARPSKPAAAVDRAMDAFARENAPFESRSQLLNDELLLDLVGV
jgi:hypothetical protein